MKVALYARVSTDDKGQDPAMQVREMLEMCQRRKWEAEIFSDPGWSGSKEQRPQLDLMMAACRRRKFDAVMVYRFDRFARSLGHLVNALEEFKALGIQFVSVHEQIDTSLPHGVLMFQIIGAFAEFERNIARQRVRSGLANARANGKTLGRPQRVVDVDRIAALRSKGRSWRQIGVRLKIKPSTARRAFLRALNHSAPKNGAKTHAKNVRVQ
ncbi:MAG: recombinase family protein [Terriglobales bacterium]